MLHDCEIGIDSVGVLPKVESLKTLFISTPMIACFPNVEDLVLTVRTEPRSLASLKGLPKLKKLGLHLDESADTELYSLLEHLVNQNTLERLDLGLRCVRDKAGRMLDFQKDHKIIDLLGGLTKLRSLKLKTWWPFQFRLVDLVRSLSELRSLVIDGFETSRN